jgi:hypothetical protein
MAKLDLEHESWYLEGVRWWIGSFFRAIGQGTDRHRTPSTERHRMR